jgi:hypothetical protein
VVGGFWVGSLVWADWKEELEASLLGHDPLRESVLPLRVLGRSEDEIESENEILLRAGCLIRQQVESIRR